MENENSWKDISKDISDVAKKIKDKVSQEDLLDDLKDSFKSTVEASADMLNGLIKAIDETVKDDEIKLESKQVLKKINIELEEVVKLTKSKITNIIDLNIEEEE